MNKMADSPFLDNNEDAKWPPASIPEMAAFSTSRFDPAIRFPDRSGFSKESA